MSGEAPGGSSAGHGAALGSENGADVAPGNGAGHSGGGNGFVNNFRARGTELRLGAPDAPDRVTLRVQVAEVWDSIRVSAPASEPVLAVKVAALEVLFPDAAYHDDFVAKLHGFEVLDENASLAEAGAREGSTFLLAHRRRRPIR
jgi:hypothetical protein